MVGEEHERIMHWDSRRRTKAKTEFVSSTPRELSAEVQVDRSVNVKRVRC